MKQNKSAVFLFKIKGLRFYIYRFCLKQLGMYIGKGSYVERIYCNWYKNITIGENCTIRSHVRFWIKRPFSNENYIKIGNNVFIGEDCFFNCSSHIIVGDHCLIGSHTIFTDINHGMQKGIEIDKQSISMSEIILGNDIWIGTRCTILKGVKLNSGCVVGANSLVNKSIPSNEIWAGTPAKKIGERIE